MVCDRVAEQPEGNFQTETSLHNEKLGHFLGDNGIPQYSTKNVYYNENGQLIFFNLVF